MRNGEYYADPTASEALKIVKHDENQLEQQALTKAVKTCKKILKEYGFTLVGRMKLRGERSGKTYE